MVNYGNALEKSRRQGWEDAYLDYGGLKKIHCRLEALLVGRDDDTTANLISPADRPYIQKYIELRTEFADKLHCEIEKISLFSLTRLGELANAIGFLRFANVGRDKLSPLILEDNQEHVIEEPPLGSSSHNYDEFGEKASLLPSSDSRCVRSSSRESITKTSATRLFSRSKLVGLVGNRFNVNYDKIDIYSYIGVELLHILKYTCVNAAGIRKISKKYAKLVNFFPVVKEADETKAAEKSDLLMPKEVAQNYATIADYRIDQLTNSKDFATIFASLLDALKECEKDILMRLGKMCTFSPPVSYSSSAVTKLLIDSTDIPDGTALLRFECTTSSIHTLIDFSRDASRPFSIFLSRRAMINTGKDQGELGNAEKKALALLLEFQPDFILDMSENELRQWYKRVTSTAKKVGQVKASSAFIDFATGDAKKKWGGVDGKSMIINLISTLLYTVNYYIIAPTANHYAMILGVDGAYGATLIGASSLAAIFAAFFYSVWYMKGSFWTVLAFSALCPFLGNILYSLAISYDSIKIALFGRILCGFGSAEVVNRQLISACVSYQTMTKASALFVSVSAAGMSIGPLIAALLDMFAGRDEDVDIELPLPGSPVVSGVVLDHVTMPGFIMAFLWGLQLISVILVFKEPERINDIREINDKNKHDVENANYGSVADSNADPVIKKSSMLNDKIDLLSVIGGNVAFLVTLYLFAFIELSGEVLISSCSMIVRRYFRWHGSRAGFIIASLGALVLPAHFLVEHASRIFSERQIMKYSIVLVMFSCMAICNIEGLMLDIIGIVLEHTKEKGPMVTKLKEILHNANHHGEFPYDFGYGEVVYLASICVIFIATIILEGVNTSLMSKTAPTVLNTSFMNMGLIATLVGTFGRVVGDGMITMSAFIGKAPYHDFVSVMFLPLLPILALGLYWTNKNWKHLV